MDIHPPEGRVESLRDFAKHILIVTIGILIALGLEGIRESWRERSAVREVRQRLRAELVLDQDRLKLDQADERRLDALLDQVISDMPQLQKNTVELETRVQAIRPAFYNLSTSAWDSASTGGALEHMNKEELAGFVDTYEGLKFYSQSSRDRMQEWIALESYFQSHHYYTILEEAEGEQRLRTLRMGFSLMESVARQTMPGIETALKGNQ